MRPKFCRGFFAVTFLFSFLSTGFAQVETNRAPGTQKWAFQTRGAVIGGPALSEDGLTLYAGSADRHLYAIDTETGEELWRVRLPRPIISSVTVDGERIYVPCSNGRLYCIEDTLDEGVILWSFRTQRTYVSSPVVDDDGNIYFGSSDNRLYGLEPEEGLQLGPEWPFQTRNDVGTPMIATGDGDNAGTIYVVAGPKLFGVSADGEEISQFAPGTAMRSIPVVGNDGSIYIGANDERVYGIDSGGTTNDVRWRYNTRENVTSSPVMGADGNIYIGSENGRLYKLNTNGQVRAGWPVNTRRPVHGALSIGADGTVYAGSDDTRMYAISSAGEVRWTFKTRGRVRSAAAIDNQGIIYFGSNDKNVYAVYDDEILTDENVWPMFRRDRLHTARATGGEPVITQQPLGAAFDSNFIAAFEATNTTQSVAVRAPEGTSSLSVTAGTNVLVSILVRGASDVFYQWQFNGEDITNNASATHATLVLTNVQFADAGEYTVVIESGDEEITSSPFTLNVTSPPVLDITATNEFVLAGGTLTLNANATGPEPLFYQWKFNGVDIPGQTNASLVITNVQTTNMGTYTVMVMNQFGNVTSPGIVVRVFETSLALARQPLGAGQRHSLAVLDDNSLWAWGLDNSGQLGDARNGSITPGGPPRSSTFPLLIGSDGAGSTNAVWQSVSGGGRGYDIVTNQPNGFSLGLQTNGTLWAWGQNDRGQLGIGATPLLATVPTRVGSDSNWIQVEAGATHGVALKRDGSLWAWGANDFGQLGIGSTNGSTTPVRVGTGSAWVEVRAGGLFTLARRADGSIWGWGANTNRQLGLGGSTATRILSPMQIGAETNWAALSAGVSHSLALKTDGTLWAWGAGNFGQLGTGGASNSVTPVRVGDATWASIEAGSFHSFAIQTNGSLFAWGANWFGQLGVGAAAGTGIQTNNANKFSPTEVAGTVAAWRTVDASTHSLGIDTAGNVYAWGFNSHGQLGNNTTNNSIVPVQLVFTNTVSTSITNAPPTISIEPTNAAVLAGSTASFFVNATGAAPLVFQWYFNSNAISAAANTSAVTATLSLSNVQPANAGFYHVVITNSFGTNRSTNVSLTVTDTNGITYHPDGTFTTNGIAPTVTESPVGNPRTALTNSVVTFSVSAIGTPQLFYQWRFNSNAIPASNNASATSTTLILEFVQTTNSGFYDVVVTNLYGAATSAVARLIVTNGDGTTEFSFRKSAAGAGVRLAGASLRADGVVLEIQGATAEQNYVLEFAESLIDSKWTPLSTNRGPVTTVIDPALPPRANRFYRLRVE